MSGLVENGLCPWGSPAILFEDNGCHTFFQSLEVVPISLAMRPPFGLLFSEKFIGNGEVRGHRVDLDCRPARVPTPLAL